MALKQFLSSAIKLVPQSGFSVVYTENGGVEAQHDVLIRTSDLTTTTSFRRGAAWETIFPQVPTIFSRLTLKKSDPTDRGDGFTIVKCTFTGYTYAGADSSGEEQTVATSTLSGQLNPESLASHPKWSPLSGIAKTVLGYLISGQYVWDSGDGKIKIVQDDGSLVINETLSDNITGDASEFANIIAGGETTWDRAGWTYSYHTEGSKPFTSAELNSLNKIVDNPPGDPKKPSNGWCYMLASVNQTQSGPERFMKTLDFRLIPDNAKNRFLYD